MLNIFFRCRLWISSTKCSEAIKLLDEGKIDELKKLRICSDHFSDENFRNSLNKCQG